MKRRWLDKKQSGVQQREMENIPQEMENKLLLPVDKRRQMKKKKNANPDNCGS